MLKNLFFYLFKPKPQTCSLQEKEEEKVYTKTFRFIGYFKSECEENSYTQWRDINDIFYIFHETLDKNWPKRYMITINATEEQIDSIKNSLFYSGEWNPGMATVSDTSQTYFKMRFQNNHEKLSEIL